MKLTIKNAVSLLLAVGVTGALSAGPFSIGNLKITDTNSTDAITQSNLEDFSNEINKQLQKIEDNVNNDLPEIDAKSYADGVGTAGLMATRGIGIDYASNIKLFTVGGHASLAVDGEFSDPAKAKGLGTQVSAVGGMNLGLLPIPAIGPVDPKKGILFVNFFSMDIPDFSDEVSGGVTNFGAHVRYTFFDGVNILAGLAYWTGININTGIDYSSFDLTVQQDFNQALGNQTIGTISSQSLELRNTNYKSTAELGIKANNFTVPVEVSTGGKILYFLQGYVGFGTDIALGGSETIARTKNESFSGDLVTSDDVERGKITGDASIDLGAEGGSPFMNLRTFAGLGIDFAVWNIQLHYNHGLTTGAKGAVVKTHFYF